MGWISKASRSRIDAFVKTATTIRKHRDGILAAIRLKINNGRAEGFNNHVRLIINRAYGFHSAQARLAIPGPRGTGQCGRSVRPTDGPTGPDPS